MAGADDLGIIDSQVLNELMVQIEEKTATQITSHEEQHQKRFSEVASKLKVVRLELEEFKFKMNDT